MSDPSAYSFHSSRLSAEEGGFYVVSFPDIPGCLGVGATQTEAIEDGRNALRACLDALRAVDRSPPPPSAQEPLA